MNLFLKILRGTLPWLIFSLAMRYTPTRWIGLVWTMLLIIQFILGWKSLKAGNPLAWIAIVLFASLLANGYLNFLPWASEHAASICYVAFCVTACASVLFGAPFTVSHAKLHVPKEFWRHPAFIRINQMVSLFWAAVFAVNGVIVAVAEHLPWVSQFVCTSMLVIGVVFSEYYPHYARKRASAAI